MLHHMMIDTVGVAVPMTWVIAVVHLGTGVGLHVKDLQTKGVCVHQMNVEVVADLMIGAQKIEDAEDQVLIVEAQEVPEHIQGILYFYLV